MNNIDYASLIERVAQGNQSALRTLYDQKSPYLFALAKRMMNNDALAEDVLQESFIIIWRKAHQFQADKGAAAAWLTTIVRNKCIDRLRRRAVTVDTTQSQVEAIEDLTANPFEAAVAMMEGDRLKLCIKSLNMDQQRAILHAYYDGFTHEEIASRLLTPLGTIKSWIRRGLQQLKGCLGS